MSIGACMLMNDQLLSLALYWIQCTLTDHRRTQSIARSCDVAIVVVVVRRERRIEEEEKKDGQLAVNIYSAFFLSEGNITINRNDMQIVFVVVRRRGKFD